MAEPLSKEERAVVEDTAWDRHGSLWHRLWEAYTALEAQNASAEAQRDQARRVLQRARDNGPYWSAESWLAFLSESAAALGGPCTHDGGWVLPVHIEAEFNVLNIPVGEAREKMFCWNCGMTAAAIKGGE